MTVGNPKFIPNPQDSNRDLSPDKLFHLLQSKYKPGIKLNKDELNFLYEVNSTFHTGDYYRVSSEVKFETYDLLNDQSFSNKRVYLNNIVSSRKNENTEEDQLIIFGCKKEQIAHNLDEIRKDTKAYIGEWNPEIAKKIPESITYLYEEFPDKKIFRKKLEVNPKTGQEYYLEILEGDPKIHMISHGSTFTGMEISEEADYMLRHKMKVLEQKEELSLEAFSVVQLGFPDGATTEQIYNKIKEKGFKLCPHSVAPELRISYKNQPCDENLIIATNPINCGDGNQPHLFNVFSNKNGDEFLASNLGDYKRMWLPSIKFVVISSKG